MVCGVIAERLAGHANPLARKLAKQPPQGIVHRKHMDPLVRFDLVELAAASRHATDESRRMAACSFNL
jgi:hypothetical protein